MRKRLKKKLRKRIGMEWRKSWGTGLFIFTTSSFVWEMRYRIAMSLLVPRAFKYLIEPTTYPEYFYQLRVTGLSLSDGIRAWNS